jgi:hypothetical protein
MLNKKFISVSMMLILILALLASCANDDSGADNTTSPDNIQNDLSDSEASGEFDIYSILPEANFSGQNFNVYVPPNFYSPVDIGFTAEEQTGEKFNDEVYKRNRQIEEHYNFKFNMIYGADPWTSYSDVRTVTASGDNTYDVFFTHIWSHIANFAAEGLVSDWNGIPHVDLTQAWWNQSAINAMKIANKTFYVSGAFHVQDVIVLVANMDMVADLGIESPYKLVKEGKWTFDNVGEIAKSVTFDLNGDGIFDKEDRYGIEFGGVWQMTSLVYAAGGQIIELDKDGVPSLTLNNAKMISIFDKLTSFIHDDNKVYIAVGNTEETWNRPHIGVQSGQILFTQHNFLDCGELRHVEANYMILPLPKYDEAQSDYLSASWTGSLGVPRYIEGERAEMVGIIMEAMAAEGSRNILPTYYEAVLSAKYAHSDEAIEMIDVILNSVIYDLGMCYNDIGLPAMDFNTWIREKRNYVSTVERTEDRMKAAIDNVYEKIIENYN